MSYSLQQFLADATIKAAVDLENAFSRLPADKRDWVPAEGSRSAINQVAECAIMNSGTIDIIHTKLFPADFDLEQYQQSIAQLTQDWSVLQPLLHQNAAQVAEVICSVPDEDLAIQIDMPWGPMTLAQIISYPYWNMTYHEGQINYIASILGHLN
jgi:uncharacterized damage-inducible protein DinB